MLGSRNPMLKSNLGTNDDSASLGDTTLIEHQVEMSHQSISTHGFGAGNRPLHGQLESKDR